MRIRCADHLTPLYTQKLALTSPTGGGRSVGIVRSRTKATESFILSSSATSNLVSCLDDTKYSLISQHHDDVKCVDFNTAFDLVSHSLLCVKLVPLFLRVLVLVFPLLIDRSSCVSISVILFPYFRDV